MGPTADVPTPGTGLADGAGLADFVLARMQARQLTQAQLCQRAGISRQTLHILLYRPEQWPTLPTLFALGRVLKVHPTRLVQLVTEARPDALGADIRSRSAQRRGDRTEFVRDVTFPDGAWVVPGPRFTKVWEVHNVGSVAWEGRFIHCMDEQVAVFNQSGRELLLAQPLAPTQSLVPIATTAPGAMVQVAVEFTAPLLPGTVLSYWKSVFADGRLCFPRATGLWVKVQVVARGATAA
jgi:transcriptional regulator with XRE-family HTH domain